MRHSTESGMRAPSWPSYIVLTLLLAQVLTGIWVIVKMKNYRWFASFTVVLQQWFGLACTFVSGMSVTGEWL
jgi:hypothetical protein